MFPLRSSFLSSQKNQKISMKVLAPGIRSAEIHSAKKTHTTTSQSGDIRTGNACATLASRKWLCARSTYLVNLQVVCGSHCRNSPRLSLFLFFWWRFLWCVLQYQRRSGIHDQSGRMRATENDERKRVLVIRVRMQFPSQPRCTNRAKSFDNELRYVCCTHVTKS